ncbi:MAG: NAD(P)H-hydrate dehydratase [Steroidobacteraceae bacterium]
MLPAAVYSTQQVRQIDQFAIHELGIEGYELMARAADAALRQLRQRWPLARRIAIVCGSGNNGGDGYVLGRLAQSQGLVVDVCAAVDPARLAGDAARACADFTAAAGHVVAFDAGVLRRAHVVVDGFLGTGLADELRADAKACIAAINASRRPVLSLDLPSGLDGDSGRDHGAAVLADCTVTFVALKAGLFLGDGPQFTGDLALASLGIDVPDRPQFHPILRRVVARDLSQRLQPRPRRAHKGQSGRALIVGGGPGMPGAARLAGEAALRCGAGLVVVAAAPESTAAIAAGSPELICRATSDPGQLRDLIDAADVIGVGPGLGQSAWSRALLDEVLASDKPLVVDADALNLIASSGARRRERWILTPHPGEAARLLDVTAAQIEADRVAAVRELHARYGGVIALKGAGTLIAEAGEVMHICDLGNPGMATAGMGDVLTGAIAGLLAQLKECGWAARLGVYAHAAAGDLAAGDRPRGLMASDLLLPLRQVVNPLEGVRPS